MSQGFTKTTQANQWVTVTLLEAHAWVEVYIDGFGWVPVEVTAGGPGGEGNSSEFGGAGDGSIPSAGGAISETDPETELETITITSGDRSKVYDGTPLTYDYYYPQGTLKPGHRIDIDITGSITQVEAYNAFEARIVDSNNIDMSDQYNIRTIFGQLAVVPNNDLPIIEFKLYDISKTYSGEYISHKPTDYYVKSNNLPVGYKVSFEIVGSIKDAGLVNAEINKTTLRIFDESDMDVTHLYNVVTYFGTLEVVKRSITVTAFSAQKYYDGTPLTADTFYIAQGSKLVEGDEIIVEIFGSITEIGTTVNEILSVALTDKDGNDVTDNYKITTMDGTLEVLED